MTLEVFHAMPWKEIIGNLLYFVFLGIVLWYGVPYIIKQIKLVIRIIKRKNG